MSGGKSPKIISVTGAHSSVGKTTLCSLLLKELKGFGAVKFTRTPLFTTVTDDPETILKKDKDTAIMSASGAEKVVWIQSPRDGLENALDMAMRRMHGLDGVVVEGNSPADFIRPDQIIFIVGEEGQIKPSAVGTCKKADIVIINSGKDVSLPPSLTSILPGNVKTFRIDLANKSGEIDKFVSYIKQYMSK